MIAEIWKDIKGYEGLYQVSNLGRVKSLNRYVKCKNNNLRLCKGKILSSENNGNGYLIINLSKNGKIKINYIHKLVAEAFIPNPENLPQINHKDECKTNNIWANLEWCSSSYNANYGTRNQKMRNEKIKKYGKKINQYDLNNNLINTFDSLSLIAEKLNYCPIAISNCCKGKTRTSYGYIWRFTNE